MPENGPHCWALALGGTRRAYLAQGGQLVDRADLEAYFTWLEAAQLALLDRLYARGVQTIITVGRVPADRGQDYSTFARRALEAVIASPARRAFYQRRGLQVSLAGDLAALEQRVAAPGLAARAAELRQATANGSGGKLIYLFRGDWLDAAEEAQWGVQVAQHLGRMPTRDQLVQAFYGRDLPPLSVYIGSGRPQIGLLRPPFLSGQEDCYWAANCPLRLAEAGWDQLIVDHQQARRTHSARTYPSDPASRAALAEALAQADGQILGVGQRHALGFWMPMAHL